MRKFYLKWLWEMSSGYKIQICFIVVLNFFAVILALLCVEMTQVLVSENQFVYNIWILIFVLILAKLIQIAFESLESYLRQLNTSKLSLSISCKLFDVIFQAKSSASQKFHSGDEMNRLTTDVGVVTQCIVNVIPTSIYAIFQLLTTAIYLLFKQPILTLCIVAIMPLAIFMGNIYTKKLLPLSKSLRILDAKLSAFMQEHLQFKEIIYSLNRRLFVMNRLDTLQKEFLDKNKTSVRLDVAANTIVDFAFDIGFLTVLVWGAIGIHNGTFSFSQLIVFMQLSGSIQRPVIMFKIQYPQFVSSLASMDRLIELSNLEKEKSGEDFYITEAVGIKFSDVSFRYNSDSEWVHKNFNAVFEPGKITAIVGETGIGKTTIIKLILALEFPQNGSVKFFSSSENAKDNIHEYLVTPNNRCNCTYVPQGNMLLSGTIRYNLLLGNPVATDEEMKNALFLACADFVFEQLPQGLETEIGEFGLGLSEGQAQRIAIARGLLKKASVILLDEPSSALDESTEIEFFIRLKKNLQGKTIIIITHRLKVLQFADNTIKILPVEE